MNNITATILILASLGLFFGYVNPAYQKDTGSAERNEKSVSELLAERAEYRAALLKTREIELARTGLLAKYNDIAAADREKLERMLPDHSDTVRFVIDTDTIAAAHNLALLNITVADKAASAAPRADAIGPSESLYEATEFIFGLRGSYEDFRLFLEDVERNLRLTDSVFISFGAALKDLYDYKVTVRTYRLK